MSQRGVWAALDLGALAALYAVCIGLVFLPLSAPYIGTLGPAISIDLVLTASLAHYVFGVRFAGLPRWTVGAVAGVGTLLTGWLIPQSHSSVIGGVLLAAVELGVLGYLGWSLVRLVRRGRAHGELWAGLEAELSAQLGSPWLAHVAITEAKIGYFAFIAPFRRAPTADAGTFFMHREVSWVPMAAMLQFLTAVEVPLMHLVIDAYLGPWVAWPVSILSVYGSLWLWGDAQAMRLMPTRVDGGVLGLQVGLRWTAHVPLTQIIEARPTDEKAEVDCSVFGEPVVELVFDRPVLLKGLFGLTRRCERLSLQVDDVPAFLAAVRPVSGR